MELLPESTRLLYSQLLSECLHGAAPSGRGLSFVSKTIRGGVHWYLQLTVGSMKSQHYLGPESVELKQRMAQERARWARAGVDIRERQRLVSMLVSGDAYTVGSAEARVLEILERAGVFLVGGVLVGSQAFPLYGNMLGAKWRTELTRTQDVDIAGDYRLSIGIEDRKVSLRQALVDSDMGFFEVPALSPKAPSTKFKIRGKQLSVDILTPMIGKTVSSPVHLRTLDSYAEPVRFLDYLLIDVQPAVVVAKSGILVNVPSPARYALHKLVTSQRRTAAMQTKVHKDIAQAEQLIAQLLSDRPGDLLVAADAAREQPTKFLDQLRVGIKLLPTLLATELCDTIGIDGKSGAKGA